MMSMSANSCLRTANQVHTRWLDVEAEAVRWGSDAARDAVERICQKAALRCQRTIATYASVDIPDETAASTGPRSSAANNAA